MINISRPYLDEKEADAAREVILSGWVTQGPKVKEFEESFASFVGSRYACAVSSCTTALHLALLAVGVKPGDFVITVSHSFIATANSIRHCGAEPLFVDIEGKTFNMSPESLEKLIKEECCVKNDAVFYKKPSKIITEESMLRLLNKDRIGRIGAILPVHQMGMACDIMAITEIAQKYKIPVVEDAACAIGSEVNINNKWEKIGKPRGDAVCFSFHPRKVITTGDGGMITTNNSEYDEKFRLLRQHGMNIPDTVRHKSKNIIFEEYITTAYNYRMTDIQASIGIEQLKKLCEIIEKRRSLDKLYRKYSGELPWLELPYEPPWARSNWQSYAVRILKNAPLSRNEIIQHLLDNNVASKPGIMNAHREPPYIEAGYSLKNSEMARDEIILLPLHNFLEEEDIKNICNLLRSINQE